MSKTRVRLRRTTAEKRKRPADAFERLDPWLLGAMAALFVGRPLLASEGVAWLGDGLPWVMLWFLLAAIVCLLALRRGRLATPLGLLDAMVMLLMAWHTLAAVVALGFGSPRPALNMLWEWAGMGLSFFCARQLLRGPDEARGMVAVMISLVVGLSSLGYEQFLVQMPAARAQYAIDPESVLKAAGWDAEPGSPERQQFESRLNSSEPVATFALTNSFAGVLAPWLVALVGAAMAPLGASPNGRRRWFWRAGLLAAFILGCLLLTKSRSGWVGCAAGCAGLIASSAPLRRAFTRRRRLLAVAGAAAALVAIAVVARGLDGEAIAGAKKSLGYRFEYWQATAAMIREYPWFGCGPGNFQDYYTAYKLPQASEEIRDPHNFLLELAATAGIPTALAMLGVLAVFFVPVYRSGESRLPPGPTEPSPCSASAAHLLPAPPASGGPASGGSIRAIAFGGACGLGVAEALGWLDVVRLGFERIAIIGLGAAAAWFLLRPWTRGGKASATTLAMAMLAQLVHHLASGGIGYPSVAGSFWLLMAAASRMIESEAGAAVVPGGKARPDPAAWRRFEPTALLTAIGVGGFACFITGYLPVLDRASLLRQAGEEDAIDARHEARQRDILLAAARADPASDEPPRVLAQLHSASLLKNPSAEARLQFDAAVNVMFYLRPHSSSAWLEAAEWYAQLYKTHRQESDATLAMKHAAEAVKLYPNSAQTRAHVAEIYALANRPQLAANEAREAARLDALTPHLDKKLNAKTRERMRQLAQPAP